MSTGPRRKSDTVPDHPDCDLLRRMLKTVNPNNDDCLKWPRCLNAEGKGVIQKRGGKKWRVHRLAYELAKGPIPAGSPVHQECRNASCFRPSHLYTQPAEHELLRDMINKKRGNDCINWPHHQDERGRGYVWVKLPTGAPRRRGKMRIAARVAYELEEGRIPRGKIVCHRCDNPSCIRPSHLYLGTILDNNRDCNARGRRNQCIGERHPSHKLTKAKVREIYRLRSRGWKLREVAYRFEITYGLKVSTKLISDIGRGIKWKHIWNEAI